MAKTRFVSIETSLKNSGYIVTDDVLADLSRQYARSRGVTAAISGCFHRVLLAHVIDEIRQSKARRQTQASRMEAFNAVYDAQYEVITDAAAEVLQEEGISEDNEVYAETLNARTNFARQAKSLIKRAIEAGAAIETLDPTTTTKAQLREFFQPSREGLEDTADRVDKTMDALEDLLHELAEEDMQLAQEKFEDIQVRLAQIVARPLTKRPRRVKDMTLHPH